MRAVPVSVMWQSFSPWLIWTLVSILRRGYGTVALLPVRITVINTHNGSKIDLWIVAGNLDGVGETPVGVTTLALWVMTQTQRTSWVNQRPLNNAS